jgi:hypothetical protein
MNQTLKFILLVFGFQTFSVVANPGDTTWVTIYNQRKLTYYGNYDTTTTLPTGKQYRKIRLHYILGRYACPAGTQYCGSWDYTTQIYAKPPGHDTVEIARVITPYATDWLSANRKHDYVVEVTDYASVLEGNLGIMFRYEGYSYGFTITLKLELIEGTPPMNVVSMNNIYDGYFAYGKSSEPIEQKLIPKSLQYPSPASNAVVKNYISGHGADDANCAEFCSKYYNLKLDGSQVAQYQIWRNNCGVNDVYPQTGTWLYDRANWCPGAVVWPVYHNITSLTAANTQFSVDIDLQPYTAQNQNNATAGYNIVSQLISYGSPNYSTDVSIEDIISPTTNENHFRSNPACANPVITIKNTGSNTISSVVFSYGLKNASPLTYTWTGNLAFLETTDVIFPTSLAVYSNNISGTDFQVSVVSVNGTNGDDNSFNNTYSSKMPAVSVYPPKFWVITNTNKSVDPVTTKNETSWTIWDEAGNVVASRNLMDINTQYTDSVTLAPGCYKFQADDSGCDGISWWVYQYYTPNPGHGMIRFNHPNSNSTIYSPNGDFGCNIIKYFRIATAQSIHENYSSPHSLDVYPNPADDKVFIRTNFASHQNVNYTIVDISGKLILKGAFDKLMISQESISTNELSPGTYVLNLRLQDGTSFNQKIVIVR